MERKRFYIGLIVFDDNNFYIGGVKTNDLDAVDYDMFNMSYGVYHAYVDMVEVNNGGYKIERFGIENGSYQRKGNEALKDIDYFVSNDNVVAVFNAKSFEEAFAKGNGGYDLMNKLFDKEISTVIDGIRIPAKVIDNEYFVVDTGYPNGSNNKFKALYEEKDGIGVIAYEWIVNDFGETDVRDAHDGYAECLAPKEDKKKVEEPVCTDYVEDVAGNFLGDDFVADTTECKYYVVNEIPEGDITMLKEDGWKNIVIPHNIDNEYVMSNLYDLSDDKTTTNDGAEKLYSIERDARQLVKTLNLTYAKPMRVIVNRSSLTNKPLSIEIVF